MTFNRYMLALARELRAFTQADLAERSGVSQSKISKIEAGLLPPTEDDLRAFAAALELPVAFFSHRGPRPARGSICIFHRKKQSTRLRDLNRVHALFAYMRMQIEQLLEGVTIRQTRTLHQMDADALNGDVEGIAGILRQTWALPLGPVENLTTIIEHAGVIVARADFGVDDVDAMSFWPDVGPPVIFVSAAAPGDRLRFSLAHELGHLVMHAAPVGDIEDQADRFAAEFLMPRGSILAELGSGRVTIQKLAALKMRWKVSIQALARRSHDLGVVTDRQYRSLMAQISKLGWRTIEPVRVDPEIPTVLPGIVNHYLTKKGYSTPDLAELAVVLEPEFRRLYLDEPPDSKQLRLAL